MVEGCRIVAIQLLSSKVTPAGCSAGLAQRAADGVLHMCFELTQHGDSIAGILPGLSAALQKDVGLLQACLPSMALLAQLSPQHAADAVMDHMLALCSRLQSLPASLRGSSSHAMDAWSM